MMTKTYTEAEKTPKKEVDKEDIIKQSQETVNTKVTDTKDTFVYIGPTIKTGLSENTIFSGKRENIEEHLKDTLEKFPQIKFLIVTTKNLAINKAKVKKTGTLLNKYYNDILSLSNKREEG